jgi:4-amino-4-deoxy-L-arabinose transferase-like glycosyltransferase
MQNPPAVPGFCSRSSGTHRGGIGFFCEKHYPLFAVLTLALAAFNFGFRLNQEIVTTWDESLYATSAAEMVNSGNWLITTFHGEVDYYNSKPPLNIWLIAASFKLFGVGLAQLRLPSALAAWLTIALLQWWCKRCFGALSALAATIVLSTTFAFLYVHSARSGNPDAWLTLVVLATVVTLWIARTSPTHLAWLGPLLAMAFLLKGAAFLLPQLIVISVLTFRGVRRNHLAPLSIAAALFAIPVGLWGIARWRFDRWKFFDAMFNYDVVARFLHPLEGHEHGWLYYVNQLQKDHYDWLGVAAILLLVLMLTKHERRTTTPLGGVDRDTARLLGVWATVTWLIPTVMATKVPWYLNAFYPVFAIGVALVITSAFNAFSQPAHRRERVLIAAMVIAAFGVAEGKLAWYSYNQRDLSGSVQGFFIESSEGIAGQRVLQDNWDPADQFVLEHLAGGIPLTGNLREVASSARPGDVLVFKSSAAGGWTWTTAHEGRVTVP